MKEGLTFDDVLLQPAHSEVLPKDGSVRPAVIRYQIEYPGTECGMDTVTESAGNWLHVSGLGVIHKNMSSTSQKKWKVKRSENGVINIHSS